MNSASLVVNPFLYMLEPEQVINTVMRSDALRRLDHHDCRPLDKRVLRALSVDLVAFDAEVDQAMDDLPPEAESGDA